jgi:isoleucyl-tRNA synthetase
MYHIVEALVRWLAPILSFTAEEIWQYLPGQRDISVQLATWYEGLFPVIDAVVNWEAVFKVREAVSKELEKLRNAEAIGASLDAEVEIYFKQKADYEALLPLKEELRFVLITSEAQIYLVETPLIDAVDYGDFWLKVFPSSHAKCVRCWHHRADVGSHPEHPQLCGRCVENVAGGGEVRRWA